MKLLKQIIVMVDGFEGSETELISYIVSDVMLDNDVKISQEDVREADELFLSYNKYECVGDISEDEIKTLKKFKII